MTSRGPAAPAAVAPERFTVVSYVNWFDGVDDPAGDEGDTRRPQDQAKRLGEARRIRGVEDREPGVPCVLTGDLLDPLAGSRSEA